MVKVLMDTEEAYDRLIEDMLKLSDNKLNKILSYLNSEETLILAKEMGLNEIDLTFRDILRNPLASEDEILSILKMREEDLLDFYLSSFINKYDNMYIRAVSNFNVSDVVESLTEDNLKQSLEEDKYEFDPSLNNLQSILIGLVIKYEDVETLKVYTDDEDVLKIEALVQPFSDTETKQAYKMIRLYIQMTESKDFKGFSEKYEGIHPNYRLSNYFTHIVNFEPNTIIKSDKYGNPPLKLIPDDDLGVQFDLNKLEYYVNKKAN